MNITQAILHTIEEGKGGIVKRLVPFFITLLLVGLAYNFRVYHGLDDAQSMDNAQLARQLDTGAGYTTKIIRPAALAQMNQHAHRANYFAGVPAGAPRLLPDTYNAPGYPVLLAAWFKVVRPHFDEASADISGRQMYSPDRFIPFLNQIFLLLTAALVFVMGARLFDRRVAWMALIAFLVSDIAWQYSLTALSTSFLMFLITALFYAALEIYLVSEAYFESHAARFWPAWIWTVILALLLGIACLTRLHLLILLLPLSLFLAYLPRTRFGLIPILIGIVLAMTLPWFWYMYRVSGSPVGTNASLLHLGGAGFESDQIYRVFQPPSYEKLLKDVIDKELSGFLWHFEHVWSLLGYSPLVLFCLASILHNFRRGRARALRWLIVGSALCLIAANNLGAIHPEAVDAWNTLVILFPCMLVIGSTFFFILLDRLNLQLHFLTQMVAIVTILLTALPLFNALGPSGRFYNYPPYVPPLLNVYGKAIPADKWITTDMPWGTAWYGNHASLWLPQTVADFETIHDDFCNSNLLVFTPVLLGQPALNLISGDDKDWFPLISGSSAPADFPLDARAPNDSGTYDYIVWYSRMGL